MIRRTHDPLTRRTFLRRAGGGFAAFAALPLLPSCAGEEVPPGIRVGVEDVPDGGRVIVMDGTVPIEIVREGEELRALSLICTHQGCQVQWREDAGHYYCPCHDGVFSADGSPEMGPPREPLREFDVIRHENYVHVDTSPPADSR